MFSGSVPRKATMTRSVSPSYAAKAWLSVAELCTHARTQPSDFLRYNVRFISHASSPVTTANRQHKRSYVLSHDGDVCHLWVELASHAIPRLDFVLGAIRCRAKVDHVVGCGDRVRRAGGHIRSQRQRHSYKCVGRHETGHRCRSNADATASSVADLRSRRGRFVYLVENVICHFGFCARRDAVIWMPTVMLTHPVASGSFAGTASIPSVSCQPLATRCMPMTAQAPTFTVCRSCFNSSTSSSLSPSISNSTLWRLVISTSWAFNSGIPTKS